MKQIPKLVKGCLIIMDEYVKRDDYDNFKGWLDFLNEKMKEVK